MNLWNNVTKDIIHKIENEPWDDWIIASDRWIRSACFVIIALAVIYFGGHVIWWMWRGL